MMNPEKGPDHSTTEPLSDVESSFPRDATEEGERINAFWTVFVLDRCWSVWMQSPSVLIDETSASTQVDTPWPLDLIGYEQVWFCG